MEYTYKKAGLAEWYFTARSSIFWLIWAYVCWNWIQPSTFWSGILFVVVWGICGDLSNFYIARLMYWIRTRSDNK